MDLSAAWERYAQDWIAWAREPGHDGFWEGTWQAVKPTLPDPGGLTVDLGYGEGRVSRLLEQLGYRVVGIDRSPSMLQAAAEPGLGAHSCGSCNWQCRLGGPGARSVVRVLAHNHPRTDDPFGCRRLPAPDPKRHVVILP